ncbi:MAG: hypothetical protein VYE68_14840 [Acidobacteriota bacterium]|nr:hypothetical protein [Acidobacteriota bacterium]
MAIRTELTLRLDNSPGAMARVSEDLRTEKVNIVALSLEATGTLHLVPDNPVHAAGLLRGRDYEVVQRDVLYIPLPNGPGAVGAITRMLSVAGINILYAYASAVSGHERSALVVAVDDAQRASTAAGM